MKILVSFTIFDANPYSVTIDSRFAGAWKDTERAAIIDFAPTTQCQTYDADSIVDKIVLSEDISLLYNDILSDTINSWTEEDRIKIAKKWLKKWRLKEYIDKAKESVTSVKNKMKKMGVEIDGKHGTRTLKDFVGDCTNNVSM